MISDPAALFALACFIGILGLLVLILPLMILFWSQVEPQVMGMVGGGGAAEDDYGSQAVLPKLMKSFGSLMEQQRVPAVKVSASEPTAVRKLVSTSRSKSNPSAKTVKAAPPGAKEPSAATSSPAKKASPSKAGTLAKAKAGGTPAAAKAKSSSAASRAKKKIPVPTGAKRDPIFGIIYTKRPKEIDDLKKIKGVAKVIEAKLHGAGIYTYRQIVEWDAAAIDAFSDTLSFKGRIRNEDWQTQCAELHQAKYGAKIG